MSCILSVAFDRNFRSWRHLSCFSFASRLLSSLTALSAFSSCSSFSQVCANTHAHKHKTHGCNKLHKQTYTVTGMKTRHFCHAKNKIISSERKCLFMPKRFWHACHNTGIAYHFAFSVVSCTLWYHNGPLGSAAGLLRLMLVAQPGTHGFIERWNLRCKWINW